jgi:uncharacterized protein (DUF1778 family)
MTRDEERRVDDLPEERGTMSAREALLLIIPSVLWDEFMEFLINAPEPTEALRTLMKRPAPWEPSDGW